MCFYHISEEAGKKCFQCRCRDRRSNLPCVEPSVNVFRADRLSQAVIKEGKQVVKISDLRGPDGARIARGKTAVDWFPDSGVLFDHIQFIAL